MNHVIFLSILLSLDCELEEKSGQFYYLFIYSVGKVRQQKKTSPYLSPHWETCGGCVSVGVVDTTNDDIARTLWRTVKWRHFTKIEKKNNQNSPKSPKSLSRVFCGQQARKKAKQQQQEEKKQKNNLNDDDDQPFPVGRFLLSSMNERRLTLSTLFSALFQFRFTFTQNIQGKTLISFVSLLILLWVPLWAQVKLNHNNNRTGRNDGHRATRRRRKNANNKHNQ